MLIDLGLVSREGKIGDFLFEMEMEEADEDGIAAVGECS